MWLVPQQHRVGSKDGNWLESTLLGKGSFATWKEERGKKPGIHALSSSAVTARQRAMSRLRDYIGDTPNKAQIQKNERSWNVLVRSKVCSPRSGIFQVFETLRPSLPVRRVKSEPCLSFMRSEGISAKQSSRFGALWCLSSTGWTIPGEGCNSCWGNE